MADTFKTSRATTDEQCGGKLYRQCPGGMCFNWHFSVVTCNSDANHINVRRQQIVAGLATDCSPEDEAWLGCTINKTK